MLQLLIDYRLGGKPRWYLASPGEAQDMQIPESARRSIVFVCYRDPKGMRLAGTAFFVSEQMEGFESWFIYLVTARHVIAKIKEKSVDHKAYLRVNPKDGRPPHLVDVDVDRWVFPEDDPFTDIAAMMWAPPENVIDYQSVPMTMMATDEIIKKEQIGAGDEVFLIGLFANHYGEQRNIPIVRVGNIAAMPEEPVQTRVGPQQAYLVESRSIGGLSGAPVFVSVSGVRRIDGQDFVGGPIYYWLGIMQGHWDLALSDLDAVEDEAGNFGVNMGIAIVIPATKLLDVINQSRIQDVKKRETEKRQQKKLPSLDEADESVFTEEDFEQGQSDQGKS